MLLDANNSRLTITCHTALEAETAADPGTSIGRMVTIGAALRTCCQPALLVRAGDMGAASEHAVIEFLKRRYARAIARGDDKTATRLRAELDRLMNGAGCTSDRMVTPEFPELPPAA